MKKIGIYIHIPFCISKCIYCDFLSAPADENVKNAYVEALCAEIRDFTAKNDKTMVSSIYFGGGTPSCISANLMEKILKTVKECFILEADCEISMECNPGTVDEYKLKTYIENGVNRLSFGLQSVNNSELLKLGRIHKFEDFLKSYELARRAGFKNVNVDLMSALPGQTSDSWKNTLKTVCRLKTEHISAYSLIIEDGTKLKNMIDSGVNFNFPDEDAERGMYYLTNEILSSYGYERYEISNHALKGYECRHNIMYWKRGDYAGFGIGAAGFISGRRYTNTRDLKKYIENPMSEKMESYKPSSAEAMAEFMYLGLRMSKGISVNDFRLQFGKKIENVYSNVISKYEKLDLIHCENERIWLTDKGIDVSNVIFSDFVL